jgi:hypothetical protein
MNRVRPGLAYITRRENCGRERPSWLVRVPGHAARYVWDHAYGGKARALAAAKLLRDKLLPARIPVGYVLPPRPQSGVHLDVQRMIWVACWMQDRRCKRKRFAMTADRPFDQARALAQEWRERMIGQRTTL